MNFINFLPSLRLITIFLIGLCLSSLYFGGLWATVHQLPTTKHPYRLIFASFFLRLVLVLLCFYLLFNQFPFLIQWKFLGMLLLGFFLGRGIWIVTKVVGYSSRH